MIVCHCNEISDHDIKRICTRLDGQTAGKTVNLPDLLEALGKEPRCGRCLGTIARLLAEFGHNDVPICSPCKCQPMPPG